MGKGGEERRRREALTPEQQAERFSTQGLDFEESLRRVLAGGADDEHNQGEKGMDEQSGVVERELSDSELLEIWATTTAGVKNGSIPTFGDADSLREDIRRRFGQ